MQHSFLKYCGISFYILLLLTLSWKLFFESSFDAAIETLWNRLRPVSAKTLVIGYSEPFVSLSPLANDVSSRSRLLHIYEPLVRVNRDLKLEPALAISYGSIDDLTWEFKLRPNVFFHNGSALTMADVIFSLNEGKMNPSSGVKDLFSTISSFQSIDEQVLRITTNAPDPLLLQKLSSLLIFQKNSDFTLSIGTGPNRFESKGNARLFLRRFEQYWGEKPVFESIALQHFASKEEKRRALENHLVDIVANVPPDAAKNFQFPGFQLISLPSLEINFFMFHLDKTFRPKKLRKAVSLALDQQELAKLTEGFAQPVFQFVGSGIFGFDPTISKEPPDPKRAEELVKEISPFSRVKTALDLPKGLEIFGETVKEKLKKIGIDVSLNFYDLPDLSTKIIRRESEFFFFGWRFDLGDVSDFFTAVVHSPSGTYGQFNGGNYRSGEVDQLIELSQETIRADRRLEKLRSIMRKIKEDIIGIPLFSPEVLYGVSKELKWQPRVDGYVLAQEVKL